MAHNGYVPSAKLLLEKYIMLKKVKIPVLNLWFYILALRSIVSVLYCVTDVGSVVAF